MSEVIVIIFVLVGLTALVALVFGMWVVVQIVRGLFRATGRLLGAMSLPAPPTSPTMRSWVRCTAPLCGSENPPHAAYCRRCGSPLATRQRSRRAAMF